MNKKLFRFLSVFSSFALGFPFVKGSEKIFQVQKKYDEKFVRKCQLISKFPAFESCEKYFKIDEGKVCLNKDFIRNKYEFLDCFALLVTIADALEYGAKMFSLKLMDDLISYGNDKDNNIFESEGKNLEYCTYDGRKYRLKNSYLLGYVKALEDIDGYENFRSINWLTWEIGNFLTNHDIKKKDFVTPEKNSFTGRKRKIKHDSYENFSDSSDKNKSTSTSCSTKKL